MKLSDINLRDPYILAFDGKYYLYGSRALNQLGFDVYVSEDLENWSEPRPVFEGYKGFWADKDFWAPEVHEYNGKFMMFASFKSEKHRRGTQILISDSPLGPFTEHSKGAVTPAEWECLDGTLYIEDGTPYMVFCHEWAQIVDGTVCSMKLSDDLKEMVSEPETLWHAKASGYSADFGNGAIYVTDGPFLMKIDGELICLWSTLSGSTYLELISRSDNGRLDGKWSIDKKPLFSEDGGHGMIFKTFDGKYKFICHCPNKSPKERPRILDINLSDLRDNK